MSSTISLWTYCKNHKSEMQGNVQNDKKVCFWTTSAATNIGKQVSESICRPLVTISHKDHILRNEGRVFHVWDSCLESALHVSVWGSTMNGLWMCLHLQLPGTALVQGTSNVNINQSHVEGKISRGTSCWFWIFIFYTHFFNYLYIECLVHNLAGYTICFRNVNQIYCFQQNVTEV